MIGQVIPSSRACLMISGAVAMEEGANNTSGFAPLISGWIKVEYETDSTLFKFYIGPNIFDYDKLLLNLQNTIGD
jgi:hypothetical protein